MSNTGFVGRISFPLALKELPLFMCNKFWPEQVSNYEKFKILSVIGGIPKYLEEINPQRSADAYQRGCQIDYMIQTKFDTLYICEIKISKHEINYSLIQEVKDKINFLRYAKRFSCRPVLIHVNGVAEEVIESGFFAKIIDLGDLLT